MKHLFLFLLLSLSTNALAQEYKVGLMKEGAAIKNIDGKIVVADSVFIFTLDGVETKLKIIKRDGFTLHVTDGTTPSRYVITHGKGKLHGFAYDRVLKHEREHHHTKFPVVLYYCALEKK